MKLTLRFDAVRRCWDFKPAYGDDVRQLYYCSVPRPARAYSWQLLGKDLPTPPPMSPCSRKSNAVARLARR